MQRLFITLRKGCSEAKIYNNSEHLGMEIFNTSQQTNINEGRFYCKTS